MWLSSKSTLLRNQADLIVLRGCESYHMHQEFMGRRLRANHRIPTPRFSVQIRASQPVHNQNIFRKGSLTGKAVVLKTTALVACRFESCPFRQFTFGGVA